MRSIPQGKTSRARKLSVASAALTLLTILFTVTTSVYAQIPNPALVYSFQAGTTDISSASGLLAQGRDGNIYGTGNGQNGGANHWGGVYKITPAGKESLIASFSDQGCQGLVLALDGNFYGTCEYGGANNLGYVFKVTSAGVLTDVYDFTGANNANDAYPTWPPVLGANGDLYGTTAGNCGGVYRVSLTGSFKFIYGATNNNPCQNFQLSAGSDGNFYGTWDNSDGSVFKVTASGSYDVLLAFTSTSSDKPGSSPILASNGKLYGTNIEGGTNGSGAIYSLTTNGKTFTDLYNVNANSDGDVFDNNLIQASDGNFYGASFGGGSYGYGTFYEMTSGNIFSVFDLPDTSDNDGSSPFTPLMQHTSGTLYGTTNGQGANGWGTFLSFDIGASPFIALVGPVAAGPEASTVQILGQGFSSSSKVEFGGTAATKVTVTGSTFIKATVPAGALTGKITVTTGSSTLSSLVTFKVTPKQTGFTPPSGAAGTVVTIAGTGLEQTTGVKFNGTMAEFSVVSDTEITATVPTGATTGKISVTTKGGTALSAESFTVN